MSWYALPETETLPYVPQGRACYWGGWGGSLVLVDLDTRTTISYVMNKMAPGVVGTNQVLTMHFGPHEVLAALSLDFDDRRSAADVEAAVSRIEREIKAVCPEVTRIFVEAKDRSALGQTETPV